ncbi:MAG: PKD domain-containing protein [Puia sp.]|nr:PKD domain-containing protein [Puia sp.]
MNGLNAGDVIAITPGTYSGANFSNLNGVSIINNGGLVNFTGGMAISNLTSVTIAGNGAAGITYGFYFQGSGTSITLQGKCTGLRLYNMDNTSVGEFFDCSANGLATYNGNPSTKLLVNTAIANIRLTSSGVLMQGSYGSTPDFKNVIDSIAVFNVIISNSVSNGQELAGASIYHLDAHDWNVTGSVPNASGDVGIFQVYGNARVHNIYRNGGYGYIMRIVNVGLDGVADSYLYNCIDLNSWQYGTIDTRVDPVSLTSGTTPPFCTGGNIHVLNNTSGNKTQADNYTTCMVIVGAFTGYKCEIRNNLSFNTFQIQADKMIQMNAGDPLPDTSNNQYYTSAQIGSVLVDQTNCYLLPTSPAIDKGYTEPVVTTDIAGIVRPQGAAYDIGAREYSTGTTTNKPPVANAGANQTITLPTSSVSLDGSASTDPDGTIASYSWTQTSGPSNATITTANAAKTTVTGLAKGTYVFTLTVTDNSGATANATVTITVNAANLPPVANAGANQTITLPTSTASLNGSASSDPDGTIASYSWVKTSGPSSGTIVTPTGATTVVNSLVQGTYVFTLTVTDNSGATSTATVTITVNAPTNQPPVANAGANQTVVLPTSSVSLNGSGSYDPDGTIASYSWAQTSGPSTTTMTAAGSATTIVNGLVQGTYVFTLTVTDNNGATSTATVTITVSAASQPPVANAGNNQTITLPTSSVSLDGSQSSDPNGTITSYSWTQASGPSSGAITSATSAKTTVTGLIQGTYVFTLTVTDNSGATATDQVTITVNAAANQPPVANAGSNMTITLPTSSVNLNGSASYDPDGTIASYSWSEVSGAAATISGGATANATVSGLQAGTYTFQLTVTDNLGATGSAQVKVIVNAPTTVPTPVANAGANQTITLPKSSTDLSGSGSTDANGTISSYAWSQTGGPVQAGLLTAGNITTSVSGLTQAGVYTFQLIVTDAGGATSTDNMTVTVLPAANQPPLANPGPAPTITLPTSSVSLNGSASYDPDGTIVSYSWTQVSGATATITGAATATPTINGLQTAGTYIFQLTVTDNNGATGSAQVRVTVNAAPHLPPIASATSQSITLPVNTITLDGTASYDPDGTITSYSWTKLSGGVATITSPTASTTTVTGMVQGQYVFQLTVTDNQGATGTAQVIVNVSAAADQPPVAIANSISVYLPQSSLTIDGSQSYDPDGSIVSYSWTKLSGPAGGTITDPAAAKTTITNLSKGDYVYQLVVTDNLGATGTTQIIVTLLEANQPPVANAGSSQTITLPVSTVTLNGSQSYDPDGTIVSYSWEKISGPGAITITNSNTATPGVVGLQAGTYVFQLTVTDNDGATSTSQVTIIVNAAAAVPVAMAGNDTTIAAPATTATLNGSNSYETGGAITTYEWQQVSGPSTAAISSSDAATTSVSGLNSGQYVFLLTVTDGKGATDTASVLVNVINTQRSYLQDQLIIYPNPATDLINTRLISDTTGNVAYRIFDITGRLLYVKEASKQAPELDDQIIIANLTKGTYFLQAIIGSDRITSKFIKQ